MKKSIKRENQILIYIKWHDAHSSSGWHTPGDTNKFLNDDTCVVEQVGWIIHEDDKEIVLCARRIGWDRKAIPTESEFGMLQKIPIGWILERKILMRPKIKK